MPNLGTTEILLILAVVVLLFGAKKLPELARGSGRALRIFKAETKGLKDDDKDELESAEHEPDRLEPDRLDADRLDADEAHDSVDKKRDIQ